MNKFCSCWQKRVDFEIRICSKDITIVKIFFEFDNHIHLILYLIQMVKILFYLIGWQKTAILWYHKRKSEIPFHTIYNSEPVLKICILKMPPSEFDINSPQCSGFNFNYEIAFQTKSLECFNTSITIVLHDNFVKM